jgi:uncharacterized cupin superfamily protein
VDVEFTSEGGAKVIAAGGRLASIAESSKGLWTIDTTPLDRSLFVKEEE